jgi:hypothetical protein
MSRWGWLDGRLDLGAAARRIYRADVLDAGGAMPWQAAPLPPQGPLLQRHGLMTK